MRTRNIAILLSIAFALGLTPKTDAANVLWDCFWQTGSGSEFDVCWYPEDPNSIPAWAFMNVIVSSSANSATLTPTDAALLVGRWNWVLAEMGEIACEATTRNLDRYFIHNGSDALPSVEGEPVTATRGSSVYLMVMAELIPEDTPWQDTSSLPPYFYGWVELQVGQDGVVRLASSALDLDGGPMIVGGGSATPEPSSAMLFVLGVGFLLMKRGKCETTAGGAPTNSAHKLSNTDS